MSRPAHIAPVELPKAYRLMNHGPTVLVSTAHEGRRNVMAAAWAMPLDFDPPKVCVVIDKTTFTRELVDASGHFALNVPGVGVARPTLACGSVSGRNCTPDKFEQLGIDSFPASRIEAPLVAGCVGWLECRVIEERHNQQAYDLFIAEVVAAWADSRVFAHGRWLYEPGTEASLRTLHYVAGGSFIASGEMIDLGADARGS